VSKLLGELSQDIRCRAVRSLLAGNDTGCFTTEQYQAAYSRESNRAFGVGEYRWCDGLADMHLRGTKLVREVSPGVWAGLEQKQP
jgi:hypothetical protein